jgi:hypothetical protein
VAFSKVSQMAPMEAAIWWFTIFRDHIEYAMVWQHVGKIWQNVGRSMPEGALLPK